jgi:hypothetical protein
MTTIRPVGKTSSLALPVAGALLGSLGVDHQMSSPNLNMDFCQDEDLGHAGQKIRHAS